MNVHLGKSKQVYTIELVLYNRVSHVNMMIDIL